MSMRMAWFAVLAIALSACASRAPREALPPIQGSPAANQAARAATLAGLAEWGLSGRVAVSNGSDGGSGRLEWRQAGRRYDVALSAPVTRQSWRVTGGDGDAVLEGFAGGPRTGPDAGALVFDATRWQIPVDAMRDWIAGFPHDPAAALHFGPDGRVDRIEEAGWIVTYADWRPEAGGIELPGRIEATQGAARVRLVVDEWRMGAP